MTGMFKVDTSMLLRDKELHNKILYLDEKYGDKFNNLNLHDNIRQQYKFILAGGTDRFNKIMIDFFDHCETLSATIKLDEKSNILFKDHVAKKWYSSND